MEKASVNHTRNISSHKC